MSSPLDYGKPQIEHFETTNEKDLVAHVEDLHLAPDAARVTSEGHGLLKSRFDEMSISQTLWVFRRSAFVALAVYTGYMCEGFEVSVQYISERC